MIVAEDIAPGRNFGEVFNFSAFKNKYIEYSKL